MKYYSNEIVFRGHPDKMCDQISGAILRECIKQDKNTRAGIEVAIKNHNVTVLGEVTTNAIIVVEDIVRETIAKIGYKNSKNYTVTNLLSKQSADIALGTNSDVGGAGDQGMMFGYACNDTKELLPTAMVMLQKFAKWYDLMVHQNVGFKPDGKAQITGVYDKNNKLVSIDTFLVSYCNDENNRELLDYNITLKIKLLCREYHLKTPKHIYINPTGRFQIGGPEADAGLTGRKIVVDAYQSFANVGGGCMNGKDPTKVDFSAAHKARQIAKKMLTSHKLKWCEVQISYAIGMAKPLAIYINSDKGEIKASKRLYKDCRPKIIIEDLHMLDMDYEELAKFGHFSY